MATRDARLATGSRADQSSTVMPPRLTWAARSCVGDRARVVAIDRTAISRRAPEARS